MKEHCDDCTVPLGTRCESAPGNCPYRQTNESTADKLMEYPHGAGHDSALAILETQEDN